ncbi:MAG: hypothetical protein KC457_28745, partial [Myxococcales bacterium]|nr:hypothetical protein [Myxococcales bacterium]
MAPDKLKPARDRLARGGSKVARGRGTSSFRAFDRALRQRPPWWGRLEARITISLVTIGILCVGASGYLVALAVAYYDRLDEQQVAGQREAIELAQPYYAELAEAQREAFDARSELLGRALEELEPGQRRAFLRRWIDGRDDVIEVVVEPRGGEALVVAAGDDEREIGSGGEGVEQAFEVTITAPLHGDGGRLQVTWAADASVQRRHQRLGELARELGTVEIADAGGDDQTVDRSQIQRAMVMARSE